MSDAVRIEDQAARYLLRRQEAQWSAADQAELDAWLEASTAHEVSYLRLEHGWRKVERGVALDGMGKIRAPHPALSSRSSARGRTPKWFWAMAASVVVTVGAWYGGLLDDIGRPAYATQIGGHQTVPLPDGSRIELNTNSRVRTDIDDKARTVWVDRGEAYFDVAHDASRPFIVNVGDRRITVLGTKFSVRRDADRVLLTVTEGRVQLDAPQAAAPAVVKGGDTAIADGANTRVETVAPERLAQDLSWRQGILTFDQTTLAEAASEFNRYNRKQLHIADAAADVRIGGSFESTNVDAFVRLLEEGFGLKAADTSDDIRITR